MKFKELFETEIIAESFMNESVEEVAKLVKGLKLFSMDKPLKKAGYKTDFMGSKALKATKKGKSFMIASEKNAEPGDDDIVQDGYVIGSWK